MDSQFLAVFKSILGVRESLVGSIQDIRGILSPSEQLHGDRIDFLIYAAQRVPLSNAQLLQDLWVLYELKEKRNGYFVEIGACDGSTLSNTLLLESVFGWQGALAEPARIWHDRLRANRHCHITDKCVYGQDGLTIGFNEAGAAEYSTLDVLSSTDFHAHLRQGGTRYDVETISLRSLLREASAPKIIDYIGLSTEGSEIDILRNFDFTDYDIRLLSIKHKYTSQRDEIHDLMQRNGFRRKFETFSMFDDWYVKVDGDNASPAVA